MNNTQIEHTINQIEQYFLVYGQSSYEEACTQQSHGEQCATFAVIQQLDMEIAVAAFLHDIGHFIAEEQQRQAFNDFGYAKHSELGAEFLAERGFSERIVRMVKFHVQAKRYLAAKESGYMAALSSASMETMKEQGGPMSDAESARFESHVDFDDLVTLRRLDDLGKQSEMDVKPMSFWLDACRKHLQQRINK